MARQLPTARRPARRWPPAKEFSLVHTAVIVTEPALDSFKSHTVRSGPRSPSSWSRRGQGYSWEAAYRRERQRAPSPARRRADRNRLRRGSGGRQPACHGERGPWRLSCGGLTRTQPCQNIFDAFGRPFYPRGATKRAAWESLPPRKAAEQAGFQTVGGSRQIRPGRLEPHAAQEPIGLVDMPQIIH